jgi:hypothetical protein
MDLNKLLEKLYAKFLSEEKKEWSEKIILKIAIASFVLHLVIIGLVNFNFITLAEPSSLLKNPIAAIYTPFSFILVYEVYLLIYYLPKSTSIYVSKQYEIITLIIFRRLFKDLSNLNLTANWFDNKNDLQFTFDLLTAIILFYLIYLFHLHRLKIYELVNTKSQNLVSISKFIKTKKWIATALVPTLILVSVFSLINWSFGVFQSQGSDAISFKSINNIFFEQFFTILIVADVFLLLFSFFHTDNFHAVIRNSGFIISTILLRISFSVDGIVNNLLILTAVIFGLVVIIIYNKFEKRLVSEEFIGRHKSEN